MRRSCSVLLGTCRPPAFVPGAREASETQKPPTFPAGASVSLRMLDVQRIRIGRATAKRRRERRRRVRCVNMARGNAGIWARKSMGTARGAIPSIQFSFGGVDLAGCPSTIRQHQTNPAGETGHPSGNAGAEGATAPETLRQKDRRGMTLWKAAAPSRRRLTDGVSCTAARPSALCAAKSLRFRDRGGSAG